MHKDIIEEKIINEWQLPSLPKKRWFEKQRWINKFDASYNEKRRGQLEKYLRSLVRISQLKFNSFALHKFCNDEGTTLFTIEDKVYCTEDGKCLNKNNLETSFFHIPFLLLESEKSCYEPIRGSLVDPGVLTEIF